MIDLSFLKPAIIIIIMTSVFSEDNEVLKRLWKEHNPEEEEYL